MAHSASAACISARPAPLPRADGAVTRRDHASDRGLGVVHARGEEAGVGEQHPRRTLGTGRRLAEEMQRLGITIVHVEEDALLLDDEDLTPQPQRRIE
ncbi:MAG: hypothetical protein MUF21_09785 [Gemmatimonadaceae bacterium]|nr:hypothetical protein [Gemmatimonadaceae bacterium]